MTRPNFSRRLDRIEASLPSTQPSARSPSLDFAAPYFHLLTVDELREGRDMAREAERRGLRDPWDDRIMRERLQNIVSAAKQRAEAGSPALADRSGDATNQ